MKKIKIRSVWVELGRQCNLSCRHCVLGESQNLKISETVIDAFLDNVGEITKLYFTGGEPTLYTNEMELFLRKIKERNIKVEYLRIITNAKDKSVKMLNLIKDNKDYFIDGGVKVTFSTDKYHTSCDPNFTEEVQNNNIKWYKTNLPKDILCHFNPFPNTTLIYDGRAKNLTEEELNTYFQIKEYVCDKNMGQMVKMEGDYTPNTILLCANGNISLMSDYSYEKRDNFSLGNILYNNLSDMIKVWNEECSLNDIKIVQNVIRDNILDAQVGLYQEFLEFAKLIPQYTKEKNHEGIKTLTDMYKFYKKEWDKHIREDMSKNENFATYVSLFEDAFTKIENGLKESEEVMNSPLLYLLYSILG